MEKQTYWERNESFGWDLSESWPQQYNRHFLSFRRKKCHTKVRKFYFIKHIVNKMLMISNSKNTKRRRTFFHAFYILCVQSYSNFTDMYKTCIELHFVLAFSCNYRLIKFITKKHLIEMREGGTTMGIHYFLSDIKKRPTHFTSGRNKINWI